MWPPNEELCPLNVAESLRRFADHGVPTGSFIRAVLENNLTEAISRADSTNGPLLAHIVAYCYHKIPSDSWGSAEKVTRWLDRKREERTANAQTSQSAANS